MLVPLPGHLGIQSAYQHLFKRRAESLSFALGGGRGRRVRLQPLDLETARLRRERDVQPPFRSRERAILNGIRGVFVK